MTRGLPRKKASGLPPYVHRKGTNRICYYERRGYRVPLPDPSAPEFWEAYNRAAAGCPTISQLEAEVVLHSIGIAEDDLRQYFYPLQANAKQRAKKSGRVYTLPSDWCAQTYLKQMGRCALTGAVMRRTTGRFDDHSSSIDRIDAHGGYTPDNCHLVAAGVNIAKRRMSVEEFVKMCRAVVIQAGRTERARTKNVEPLATTRKTAQAFSTA